MTLNLHMQLNEYIARNGVHRLGLSLFGSAVGLGSWAASTNGVWNGTRQAGLGTRAPGRFTAVPLRVKPVRPCPGPRNANSGSQSGGASRR